MCAPRVGMSPPLLAPAPAWAYGRTPAPRFRRRITHIERKHHTPIYHVCTAPRRRRTTQRRAHTLTREHSHVLRDGDHLTSALSYRNPHDAPRVGSTVVVRHLTCRACRTPPGATANTTPPPPAARRSPRRATTHVHVGARRTSNLEHPPLPAPLLDVDNELLAQARVELRARRVRRAGALAELGAGGGVLREELRGASVNART